MEIIEMNNKEIVVDSVTIIPPATEEELRALGRRYEAAEYVASASEDKLEVARANTFLIACEKAFDECPLDIDENDAVFFKS